VSLADVVAWVPALGFIAGVVGCIVLRDLLTGTLPVDQMRALIPVLQAGRDSEEASEATGTDLNASARAAQRSQWLALAALALMMALSNRPLAWLIEEHTLPGAAWIAGLLSAMTAALMAANAIIFTITPRRGGRGRTARLITANSAAALLCAATVITPWFFQPPQPRGSSLDAYVGYYQPTLASFVSTAGASVYFLIATAIIGIPCWRAARRERDQGVRTSLYIVTAAEIAAVLTIVVPQCAQSLSWTLGEPLWNERQSMIVLIAGLMITSLLSMLGAAWAPMIHSHRARSASFLIPLWREDVRALRPAWRLLRQVRDGSYEPDADMVTATQPAALRTQRHRMLMEIMDMLVPLTEHLSPAGRAQAEALTGGPARLTFQHWLLRKSSSAACTLLRLVGGYFPRRATRWWRYVTEKPLAPLAAADAACALAAIEVRQAKVTLDGEGASSVTAPVLRPVPWSDDEAVAYLRLLARAATDPLVLEARTGAFVRMTQP
jgi:hypothetical protein